VPKDILRFFWAQFRAERRHFLPEIVLWEGGKVCAMCSGEEQNEGESAVVVSQIGRESCVLVVDDSSETREVLVEVLEIYGYTAVGASSAKEAIDYLHQSLPPRLIITDLMMPVMNGWDLLDAKRTMEHLANVPVVVLSAMPNPKIEADRVLMKPVDLEKLLAVVKRYAGDSPDS
jgi:CheY-like chemotaxis protein